MVFFIRLLTHVELNLILNFLLAFLKIYFNVS